MICIVAKQFPGPDGMMAVGTRVNVTHWRAANVESLLRNRFLTVISHKRSDEPIDTSSPMKVKKVKKTQRVLQG